MPLIYHRDTNTHHEEIEYQQNMLKFLYGTTIGRILLWTIAARPWFSQLKSIYQKSEHSQKDIQPFIDKYHINANASDYKTFNEFFTRQRAYKSYANKNELIAIADSKLSCYKISDDLIIDIKHSQYTLSELVDNKIDLSDFKNGNCLIFRLAVDDYHRYVYCDDGVKTNCFFIKGMLHTIRPISSKYKAFSRNCREVSMLHTENFGDMVQIEVGAMLVGKIKNHPIAEFKRLDEKGYFEYGGSTIILLTKNNILIDDDIVNETQVVIGERIGALCSND